MRKFLASMVLGVTMCTGCGSFRAAPTPGVPQYYSQAALVLANFSEILLRSQSVFSTAHTAGTINDADYTKGMQVFASIAAKGDAVQSLIKSEAGQASITQAISDLIIDVGHMPDQINIKNPTSQAEFQTLCNTMASILQATNTLVTAPKG